MQIGGVEGDRMCAASLERYRPPINLDVSAVSPPGGLIVLGVRRAATIRGVGILLAIVGPAFPARAATFCVSTTTELNSALTTAQSNGVDNRIQLVQGTYTGSFLFSGNNGLTVEGGYTPGCGSRVVSAANTILDGNSIGQTLRLYSNVPVAFSVDGVTIKNGRALSTTDPSTMNGGGLWAIPGNTTPGGSLTLTNSTVTGNQAYQDGGGVYVLKANNVTLTNNTIQGNSSGFGGGFYAVESKIVTLTGNTIKSNTVAFVSPPPGGAGVYVDTTYPLTGETGKSSTVTLKQNTISSNQGQGMFVLGSQTGLSTATVTVTGNSFDHNSAVSGGAIAMSYGDTFKASQNTLNNNTASSNGGGLAFFYTHTVSLTDNVIFANTAGANGGGLYSLQQNTLTVTNNTLSGNSATTASTSYGGGIWLRLFNDADVANIYNNIVWGNSAGSGASGDLAIDNDGNANGIFSPVNLLNNDFNQAASGFFITQAGFTIPASNLNNQDPKFVSVAANNYSLQASSPCIDTGGNGAPGLPPLDAAGAFRIAGPAVDIGAYEFGALPYHKRRLVDFDGDLISDITVYHSASGLWYTRQSSTGTTVSFGFGGPGYAPEPGDYDGDGKTDFAVFHDATALWFIKYSSTGAVVTVGYGASGYIPVPGDYDGDGKTDVAVYHPPSGLWFVQLSSTGSTFSMGFGGTGYAPVPEDYDGDGKTDLAVYHANSGLWFVRPSSTGTPFSVGFGGSAYTPVALDYDGDGRADIAVYHPPTGLWYVRQTTTGTTFGLGFGGTGYAPVQGYYDADWARGDLAVYNSPSGLWYVRQSSTGTTFSLGFGGSGFTPVN
jgi:parallel beta-helix repeat protein